MRADKILNLVEIMQYLMLHNMSDEAMKVYRKLRDEVGAMGIPTMTLGTTELQPDNSNLTGVARPPEGKTLAGELKAQMEKKGMDAAAVAKAAGKDVAFVEKVLNDPDVKLTKREAQALALAFGLDHGYLNDFISLAGHAMDQTDPTDITIVICQQKEVYNTADINEYLEYCELEML
ncbi:MAG: hypothetical protein GXY32_08470 [Ruminococcaceae bacterium]|nr:hypothetical protein [Oscillospiraceae bacterium]